MTKKYGDRTDRELEALWALETSIASVAARFRDEAAFNFSQEVEIAAHLMVQARETVAHAFVDVRELISPGM